MGELPTAKFVKEIHTNIPEKSSNNIDKTTSKSLKCCYDFFDKRKNKKESEPLPPSPILPKVKFDDTGDFIKEPIESNIF